MPATSVDLVVNVSWNQLGQRSGATKIAAGSPTTTDQNHSTDVRNYRISSDEPQPIHTLVGWSTLYGAQNIRHAHAIDLTTCGTPPRPASSLAGL